MLALRKRQQIGFHLRYRRAQWGMDLGRVSIGLLGLSLVGR